MNRLILSLGSNIEPRLEALLKATELLNNNFKKVIFSSLYETEPVDDLDQNYFYNITTLYETEIDNPFDILKIVKDIEENIGRDKDINRPKGPRKIDIDIIFFENKIIDSPLLTIPHKNFSNRNFVLIPLLEIIKQFGEVVSIDYLEELISKNGNYGVKMVGTYNG